MSVSPLAVPDDRQGRAAPSRPRFPALDPEPDRRPWGRRAIAMAGAVTAIIVVVVLAHRGRSAKRQGNPSGSALSGVTGKIVVETPAGGLALSAPGGGAPTPLPTLGQHSHDRPSSVSLDGRDIVLGDGTVVSLGAGGPAIRRSPVQLSGRDLPYPDPLADHDTKMLVATAAGPGTDNFSLASLATGQTQSLGMGDLAEGDPQAAGAFVSVAAPGPPGPAAGLAADARVELRDVGQTPVVLATSQTLDQDVGWVSDTAVSLTPLPDPSGARVAIVMVAASGGGAGLVVVDRAGHLVGTADPSVPPTAGPPAWSPNGERLAYSTGSNSQFVVWAPGGATTTRLLSPPGAEAAYCQWAPDGVAVLCATYNPAAGLPVGWTVAPTMTAPLVAVASSAMPLAWIADGR